VKYGPAILGIAATLGATVAGMAPAMAAPPVVDRYGTLPDGRPVERYTLVNRHGMVVRVLSLGGIITEITVPDRAGHKDNVVLFKPDLAAYAAGANFSSLLGRYANRISGGGFTLDGKRHDLKGANPAGVVLHGGPDNFSQKLWSGTPFGARAGPSGVRLSLLSPDGESGFPGNLAVTVTYTLTDDNTLRLDYRATTDQPTVVNLSHHVYFNLAGGAAGEAEHQCVQILADRYAVVENQLMTGKIAPVAGTAFDLTKPTPLVDRVNRNLPLLPRGYDTPFVVRRAGPGLVPAFRAWDPASGRTLEMRTTEVSAHFFTSGNNPAGPRPAPGTPPSNHVFGYAIEMQHLPDSPNHPEFPSTVLRPGKPFTSATTWHFGIHDPARGPCPARPKS
jgi:aldose 1-epimerase